MFTDKSAFYTLLTFIIKETLTEPQQPYSYSNGFFPSSGVETAFETFHPDNYDFRLPNPFVSSFAPIFGSSPAIEYGPDYFSQVGQPTTCKPGSGGCKGGKYRTFDGTCNNEDNPDWGAANTNYNRLLPHKYSDGIHEPPLSVTGQHLPPARLVSYVMFPPDEDLHDPLWTLAAMQWGQVITHDMSLTFDVTIQKTRDAECCNGEYGSGNKRCLPIFMSDDDPFYSKFGQTCMNFIRTGTDQDIGCGSSHKPAEQVTAVTHWMDASMVYGSSQDTAFKLRAWSGGKMLVDYRQGRAWPPPSPNKTQVCYGQSEYEPCYVTGDTRTNQNPQLAVLQVMLLREHNRVAGELGKVNPHWDDETIYQESRKIVTAEYQHISYYEWLPIFLGWDHLMDHGVIYNANGGYVNDYNPHINPSVLNEHATAAFRYFHSAIQGFLRMYSEDRYERDGIRLSDFIDKPAIIEERYNFDDLARGMTTQPQQKVDDFFTSEITNYMFKLNPKFGSDLRAIDVQRSRDHGLASYNDYREFCGLSRANKFSDFSDLINEQNVEKLKSLYTFPDDVDLTVGGSLENHVENTLTGPTFLCIMTEQFYRTRVADKFFYENGKTHFGFTSEQLSEIRKATISRLFCDNGDHISVMQPRGFMKLSEKNELTSCSELPKVNLDAWTDSGDSHDTVHQYLRK